MNQNQEQQESLIFKSSPAAWAGGILQIGGMVGIRPQEGDLAGADANSQLEQVCAISPLFPFISQLCYEILNLY